MEVAQFTPVWGSEERRPLLVNLAPERDAPRLARVWLVAALGCVVVNLVPAFTGVEATCGFYVHEMPVYAYIPRLSPWVPMGCVYVAMLAAVVDHRGRYDGSALHRWTWRAAMGYALAVMGFSSRVVKDCTKGKLAWWASHAYTVVLGGFFVGMVMNLYCGVLRLRALKQPRLARRTGQLLSLAALALVLYVVADRVKQPALSSLFVVAMGGLLLGAMLAILRGLRATARVAEVEVAEGGVAAEEQASVLAAAACVRTSARWTAFAGGTTVLEFASLGPLFALAADPAADMHQLHVWRLVGSLCALLDAVANTRCLLLLGGFVGPRIRMTMTTMLDVAGSAMLERRRRDEEEARLAREKRASLRAVPSSAEARARLHVLELALSNALRGDVARDVSDEIFKDFQKQAGEEHKRMHILMQELVTAYMAMEQRWAFISNLESFRSAKCVQEAPQEELPANASEEAKAAAVLRYFNSLHAASAAAADAFHTEIGDVVRNFNHAKTPAELGLDCKEFPFTLHREGGEKPSVMAGPLKTKARAQAKYERKPGARTAWPPTFAMEVNDIIRTSVLFDDPYELTCFLRYLERHFPLLRVSNRFHDFDVDMPVSFRNVNANVEFAHSGKRFVVEVQLHFRDVFTANKVAHSAYAVVRETEATRVAGPPYHWAPEAMWC